MKKIVAIVGLCLVSASAGAMPVDAIHFKAKVLSFDEKWVKLDYADKKVQVPKASLGEQKIEADGKTHELMLSPGDYAKMKQGYLLGLAK